MKYDVYTFVYLLSNLFNVAVVHRFTKAFYNEKQSKRWVCFFSYGMYFIITSAIYLELDIPAITLLANWGVIFGISFNYKANMPKRVLSSLYILLFGILSEIVVGAITGYFSYSIFSVGAYSSCIGVMAMRLLAYIEALLLYNFKSVRKNQRINPIEWMASVTIPLMSFVLFVFIIQADNVSQGLVLVASGIIYVINIVVFYMYDSLANAYNRISQSVIIEKEKEFYFQQCEMMQKSTDNLRSFRHDMKNQLIVSRELLLNHKYDDGAKLFDELLGKIEVTSLYSNSGNITVDSIINYKLQNVCEDSIAIKTEIVVPREWNLEVSDSIIILGNLLDNALYALQQVKKSDRFLKLKVVYDRGCVVIQCMNPYVEEIQYINKQIVSSKPDKKEHGYGLKNIQSVVEKYNGCMEINHANGVFQVDILLYVTDFYNN